MTAEDDRLRDCREQLAHADVLAIWIEQLLYEGGDTPYNEQKVVDAWDSYVTRRTPAAVEMPAPVSTHPGHVISALPKDFWKNAKVRHDLETNGP